MTRTLRDGLHGGAIGEGELVQYRGQVRVVDSWSNGAEVVWLRRTTGRGSGSLHAVEEIKPEQIGCYIGYYFAYTVRNPRWSPVTGVAPGRPAPDPMSLSPYGLAISPAPHGVNIWLDHLKPGETREGGPWCASVENGSGHNAAIKTGFQTEADAKAWARLQLLES